MTSGRTHWAPDPTSRRTSPRPIGWKKICAAILGRDGYRCVWIDEATGLRCEMRATDVDHIGANDDDSETNLRSLCGRHHDKRTGAQASAARWARRQQPTKRPHPGLST
jgi:hypothetical protein